MLVARTGWVRDTVAEEAVAAKGGKGIGALLGKKLGPFPVAAWVGIGGFAGYYIYRTRKAAASGTSGGTTGDGSGTVAATGSGSYSPTGSGAGSNNPGSGNTGPSTFADNQAWATAAISYLVGLGYEGTVVNQAVQSYLASLPLNSQQQGLVNLAILKIGATPEVVAPSQNNPPPIVTPGAPGPVTGLVGHADSPNKVVLSWTPSAGATSYDVTITNYTGSATHSVSSPSFTWSDLIGGVESVHSVVAVNDSGRSAPASVTVSTPAEGSSPVATPPPVSTPAPSGGGGGGGSYTVKPGDNLWTISKGVLAGRGHGTSNADVQNYSNQLYSANRGVIGGNPNLIHPGQVFVLP